MISYLDNNTSKTWTCLSTDTKPVNTAENKQFENGSLMYEIDTSDIYMYDAKGNTWVKQTNDSGGGSGGDGVGKKTPEGGEIFNSATSAGENAHAEGIRTAAYGKQSHAEGFAPIEKVTGTLNVLSSQIVGTGQKRNTHIVVSVPNADCIRNQNESVVGFKFADKEINIHTVFTDNTNVCNVFDIFASTAFEADPQNVVIKIAEPITVAVGDYPITLIEQGAVGNTSHAEGGRTIAAGQASHAEGFGSKVLYKTASGDPIGAHAEGTNTIAMGKGSHSEGGDTHAEGKYSHAEGEETLAIGLDSHAEGVKTNAGGDYSHAEGFMTESSDYSHAEGFLTQASGGWSHTEGRNTYAHTLSHAEGTETRANGIASHTEGNHTESRGDYSHAEGTETIAYGDHSHAEGIGTTASSVAQHVQGKFNIPDTKDNTPEGIPNDKYAHIVGNGTRITPSNAHTLDWDGNAWFKGKIRVGGNNWDEGTEVGGVGIEYIGITPTGSPDKDGNITCTLDKTFQQALALIEAKKNVCVALSVQGVMAYPSPFFVVSPNKAQMIFFGVFPRYHYTQEDTPREYLYGIEAMRLEWNSDGSAFVNLQEKAFVPTPPSDGVWALKSQNGRLQWWKENV